MELLILLICAVLVVGMDIVMWRTLTPNVIAIASTTVVVLLAEFVTPDFGFVRPSPQIYLVVGLFFACGGFASFLAAALLRGRRRNDYARQIDNASIDLRLLKILLGLACFVWMCFAYAACLRVGNIYEEDFSDMLAGGVAGHLSLFAMLAAPVLALHKAKGDRVASVLVAVALGLLFLRQVKSWLVIPILFGFLMFYYSGRLGSVKATFLKVLGVVGVLVGVFFLVYLFWVAAYFDFDVSFSQLEEATEWISMHFLAYLVSGTLGFSELTSRTLTVGTPDDPLYLVGTLRNLVAIFQGELVGSAVVDNFLQINVSDDAWSNVPSLWGTLLRAGWWAFPIYGALVFALSLLLSMGRRYPVAFYTYCYLASFLAVSWFDYYYFHLAVYAAPFWFAFIAMVAVRRVNKPYRKADSSLGACIAHA